MSAITTTETPTVTTSDVLLRAADILEEFDWRQGAAGSRAKGSMCAVGAIYEAANDLGVRPHAACMVMGGSGEACVYPLAVWNDEPGRTKAEVVAELRRLAS